MPVLKPGVFLSNEGLDELLTVLKDVAAGISQHYMTRAHAVSMLHEICRSLETAREQDEGQMEPQHICCGGE